MTIDFENDLIRIRHLHGSKKGPNFPRDLGGDDSFKLIAGREIEEVIVHHSAGGFYEGERAATRIADYCVAAPEYAHDSEGQVIRDAKGKRKVIGGGRGWPGNPYTFVVPAFPEFEDGKLVLFRIWDDGWRTWHTGGVHNSHGVGICVGGWYASRHALLATSARARPTEEAVACLDALVDYLMARYRLRPEAGLRCHAELGKPACPGDFLEGWVRTKRGEKPILELDAAAEDPRSLDSVREVQLALVELGYKPGPIDGDWGPLTSNALRAFQAAEGILADGVLGPISRRALRQALAR